MNKIPGLILACLAVSCVYHDIEDKPVVINCANSDLTIQVTAVNNASKCGEEDGSITSFATGGSPPYMYSINEGLPQSSGSFASLKSDSYTITVSDKSNCTTKSRVLVISVNEFDVILDTEPDTDCISGNGTLDIVVNESNGPYQFSVDDKAFTDVGLFGNIKHGEHILSILDNDGCNVKISFSVSRGNTPTSWTTDILPIMTTSCALNGCHNGISRINDWRIYSQVKANADDIRKRTKNRSMPFDGSLTQDQIDLIGCWVDDGALNN